MCISERLKQVLDAKNMTVTEFSKVTGNLVSFSNELLK